MKFETDLEKIDPMSKSLPELREFLAEFMENRRKDLLSLKDALGANDFAVLSRIGHTFKGMCEPYGLPELGFVGAALEEQAKLKNLNECSELVSIIARVIDTAEKKMSVSQ